MAPIRCRAQLPAIRVLEMTLIVISKQCNRMRFWYSRKVLVELERLDWLGACSDELVENICLQMCLHEKLIPRTVFFNALTVHFLVGRDSSARSWWSLHLLYSTFAFDKSISSISTDPTEVGSSCVSLSIGSYLKPGPKKFCWNLTCGLISTGR